MFKTAQEIFDAVKQLKGKTVSTLTKDKSNKIVDIETNDLGESRIIIEGRDTKPVISDIVNAYNLLLNNGELERKRDLENLAHKRKQVSSIVFAIVYEITQDEAELIQRGKTKAIVLKGSFRHKG